MKKIKKVKVKVKASATKPNIMIPLYLSCQIKPEIRSKDDFPCPVFSKGVCLISKVLCYQTDGEYKIHPNSDCWVRDFVQNYRIGVFIENEQRIPAIEKTDLFI